MAARQPNIRLTTSQKKKIKQHLKRRAFRRMKFVKKRIPLALKEHQFVERTNPQSLTVANESAAVGLFRDFSLSQCLQVANYAALFEYYRIDKVVVEFRYKGASTPAYTTVPATAAGGAQPTYNQEIVNEINPVLYFKVDHDDSNAQTLLDLKKSTLTREHQLSNNNPNFTIQLKPAIQMEAYKTALTTGYMPKWGQWLKTTDDTIPHYGLKVYAVAGLASAATMGRIEVTTKIYFSCKNNQ